MRIIGCDLHARQQTLAMLDTETGEVVNLTLMHEGNEVREFYSQLPRPVLVGIEATGSMHWFLNLMEELEIECRVGHPATIRAAEPRKQKHDRRDAELILKQLAENRFPAIWLPTKELLDLRALVLCCTAISGCASERGYKTPCKPLPWPMDYAEVLACGATTGKPRSRSCRCCLTPRIGAVPCRLCTGRWKRKSKT
jgi:Transposase